MIEKNNKFYTCKFDYPFKEVMLKEKNQDLLLEIIELCLGIKVNKIVEKNSELRTGNIHVRRKTVDILLDTDIGLIDIEVNAWKDKYSRIRNTAYQASNYAKYTLVGDEYIESVKVIQLNLTYELDPKRELIEVYEIQNKSGEKYVKNFFIYEVDMDKIMEFWYHKDVLGIERYKILIMLDLEPVELAKLSQNDERVKGYMEDIVDLNKNPLFQEYMSKEEDDRKMLNTKVHEAHDKGYDEGVKEKAIETAKNLLNIDLGTVEQIASATGLSVEEVTKLKEELGR